MTVSFSLTLNSLDDTVQAGRSLALAVCACNPGALLLYAGLGMGKTTFTRALVEALPGGANAEISSPSFTIANIYCTAPVVHHYDLYRLDARQIEVSLEESFDDSGVLTIVEWAENIATQDLPLDGLCCRLLLPPSAFAVHTPENLSEQATEDTRNPLSEPAAAYKESFGVGRVLEVSALGPLAEQCLRLFQSFLP